MPVFVILKSVFLGAMGILHVWVNVTDLMEFASQIVLAMKTVMKDALVNHISAISSVWNQKEKLNKKLQKYLKVP